MEKVRHIILLTGLMVCFQSSVFAHFIWIETSDTVQAGTEQTIKIYYGEYNEGLREIKGGNLEEVEGIECWIITPDGKKTNLEVTKQEKYFQAKFTPENDGLYTIIAINKVREVMDWSKYDIGVVKPDYYASKQVIVENNQSASGESKNLYPEFAIVPYPSKDNKQPAFQLLYKNKPFPNTKLFVHAPNEWSKEFKTNDEGVFTFNPLWEGLYVIECIYKEKSPGTYNGKDYKAIRHRVTYTYQADE